MRTTIPLLAWPIILLVGCGGSTAGKLDAAVDGTGDPDVQLEPAPDPSPEPTHDPPADTETDSDCVSPTGGYCNLVEQCGCMPGFDCILFGDPSCEIIEACDVESGTRDVDAECTLEEQCGLGLTCRFLGGDPWGKCMEWCLEDSDCSIEARTCSEATTYPLHESCTGGGGDVPFGLCSQACPTASDCNLFAADGEPTGCPDGEMCVRHAPLSEGGCDVSWCIREGSGHPGGVCGMSTGDCSPGHGCYGLPGRTYRCKRYCTTDGEHACDSVPCTALGAESWPELGVCGY
jgi:hypothetical protein